MPHTCLCVQDDVHTQTSTRGGGRHIIFVTWPCLQAWLQVAVVEAAPVALLGPVVAVAVVAQG